MEKLPEPQTIDDAFQWHASITESVIQHRAAVLAALRLGSSASIAATFMGLTEPEIDEFSRRERSEVDAMCIVNIVAAAEAAIRRDFRERIRRNRLDPLSQAYASFRKSLSGPKTWRPDFDRGGILDALKASNALHNHLVTSFRQALKVRHWYAHGRYWLLKSAAIEEPLGIYNACRELLEALPD